MSWFTERREALRNKEKAVVEKVTNLKPTIATALGASFDLGLSADVDAAIKVILDDSFLKVIDRAIFAIDSTIDKTSRELQDLVEKIFDNLSELESKLENLINQFFLNLSNLIRDIKVNLVDPIVDSIFELEEKIFEDINQVLDKIFNFFTGTIKEFKDDLLRIFNPLPNPFDPCRQQLGLALTPAGRLTHVDLFNLFECSQLRRLDDDNTIIKDIQETYATLQLESFKMTCLGRGSPAFQELFMRKWLKYGQLFEMWQEFNENMTPQQAYDEAIRRLNQARSEYQGKAAEIDLAKQTADDAVNRANNAQGTANNAQNTANQAVSGVSSLQSGIQDGSVVAHKALMLRARDDNHWLRFNQVDRSNHDVFMLWRNDNQWFGTIRVQASDKLLARDDFHWMRHKGVNSNNHDCYGLWRGDSQWFNLIQVAATGNLP